MRVVPSINRPTRVNPSVFWRLKNPGAMDHKSIVFCHITRIRPYNVGGLQRIEVPVVNCIWFKLINGRGCNINVAHKNQVESDCKNISPFNIVKFSIVSFWLCTISAIGLFGIIDVQAFFLWNHEGYSTLTSKGFYIKVL